MYTLPSGPMVYTLFPLLPWKMVYTIAFCSVTSGSGDRPRKEDATVVVYTLFPWVVFISTGASDGIQH